MQWIFVDYYIPFVVVVVILIGGNYFRKKRIVNNLHLVVRSKNTSENELENIVLVLQKNCLDVDLKRFDEDKEFFEAAFLIQIRNFESLTVLKKDLQSIEFVEKISFFDSQGIV